MYAIAEGLAKVNGTTVETFSRDINERGVALEVETGTTGYKGKDRDAGGRTLLCLTCHSGDFYFEPVENDSDQVVGVRIACCGDAGLNAVMKMLKFYLQVLDEQRREVHN